MGPIALLALIFAAIVFSAGGILVSKILTKGSKNKQKGESYECGIPTTGSNWPQYHVGYYLFALIFSASQRDGASIYLQAYCSSSR